MPPPYARGHVRAPNKDHLIDISNQRHGRRLRGWYGFRTPAAFDARTMGIIGPVKDQGQCGSCWDFSGTFVCEVALYRAGVLLPDGSQALSEEYTLSCGKNGGCDGDDNVTVLDWAKTTGLPFSSDYGPYNAAAGTCAYKPSMKLYKIDDWGFADSNGGKGVTSEQDIKNAIVAYGCVGCAVAAGSSWDSWSSDLNYVHTGSSTSIDHNVGLVGWDDAKSAWIMRNSWGTSWANGGYGWIKYGADSIGTEAVWAVVQSSLPPWYA